MFCPILLAGHLAGRPAFSESAPADLHEYVGTNYATCYPDLCIWRAWCNGRCPVEVLERVRVLLEVIAAKAPKPYPPAWQ